MKNFIKFLLIIGLSLTFYSEVATAQDCTKNVQALKEGVASPCDGFLFSPKQEQAVRLKDQSYQFQEEQIKILESQTEFYKEQNANSTAAIDAANKKAEMWQKSSDKYAAKYEDATSSRGYRDLIFLGAGVVITIISGATLSWATFLLLPK